MSQSTSILLLAMGLAMAPLSARAGDDVPVRNGFRLSDALVPLAEIRSGGPPRDAIPALDAPATVPAADAPWRDGDRIIGVRVGGEARAYPIAILDWHELVNDELGGVPILVTWCPLCGTGMVFRRELPEGVRRFGVSGLLYNSDVLLFDRESESLWSQIAAKAVTGPMSGRRLELLRSHHLSWGEWKARHPETRVLSTRTGHARDYSRSPYQGYAQSPRLMFPTAYARRYHPKTPTLGIRTPAGTQKGYPAPEVAKAGGRVEERIDGHRIRVRWDEPSGAFRVEAPEGVELIEGYWFAWSAFHPEAEVYTAPEAAPAP